MNVDERKRMSEDIKKYAINVLGVDVVGIAPIERYVDCPPEFHPKRLLPNPKAVVTMGLVHNPDMVQDSNIYECRSAIDSHAIDTENLRAGYRLARYINRKWGYSSGATGLPVHLPAPFLREGLKDIKEAVKPSVFISIKMGAVLGGLGKRGVNDLLIHPEHGAIVRLVSVVTEAPLAGDPLADFNLLCDECEGMPCITECPTKALSVKKGDLYTMGSIDWQKCFNFIGNEALMLGKPGCLQCAVVCPHSRANK